MPWFLLRRAGFGFTMLESLTDAEVSRAAEGYRDAVLATDTARYRLLRNEIPTAVEACRAAADRAGLRRLSALRSAVGRRRPLPGAPPHGWPMVFAAAVDRLQTAIAQEISAGAALDEAAAKERHQRPAKLAELVADPAVLDAIVQLSPDFYDAVERAQRHGRAAQSAFGRRLYLYAQRLAAKNETTSFFGPVTHGQIADRGGDLALGSEVDRHGLPVEAFLAFWATCALARRLAADPAVRDRIPVTRIPAASRQPGRIELADGRQVAVDQRHEKVLDAVDDSRSAVAIAADVGLPLEEVNVLLRRLAKLGVIRQWPEPASTVPQPFAQVLSAAERYATATRWPAELLELRSRVEAYRDAPDAAARRGALTELETRFEALAGVPPRRSSGRMYADRSVVYLDAGGDLTPLWMGGELATAIESALTPVLDVAARYGELRHDAAELLARGVLADAGTHEMPFMLFARLVGEVAGPGRHRDQSLAAPDFAAALTDLVRRRLTGHVAELSAADLTGLDLPPAKHPRFVSPDVLVARGPDGLRFVLGELHPYVYAWGSQAQFCPDPAGLKHAFDAVLPAWGGAETLATVVHRRVHKGLIGEWFPGRFVEVTAVAHQDRRRCVPVGALMVRRIGGRVRLFGPEGELILYTGEQDHAHLEAFAPAQVRLPLVRLGGSAPRITVGRVVVQRARWWLPCGGLTGLPAVQQLRARHDLPRWVFAHLPGEPKPICVDLDAPLAVETLCAATAATPEAEVMLVEMVPGPDELWLRRAAGPTSSELRLALVGTPS